MQLQNLGQIKPAKGKQISKYAIKLKYVLNQGLFISQYAFGVCGLLVVSFPY